MSKINLTSKEWNDLVFEGRNKGYGAYDMRKSSNNRHMKALIAILIVALIVISLPTLIENVIPKREKEKMTTVTTLTNLDNPEDKAEDKPHEDLPPPPPPLKSTIKFTAPVITNQEISEEEEMKDQEDIIKSEFTVSTSDIQGTDEVDGQDIQDLRAIVADAYGDGEILDIVEQEPMFPGGEQELIKFLQKNIRYPAEAQQSGVQGRVICQFVVRKDGTIGDVKVVRKVDPTLDEEAERLINSMPKWIPGKQQGKSVNVRFTLPITFKLQ